MQCISVEMHIQRAVAGNIERVLCFCSKAVSEMLFKFVVTVKRLRCNVVDILGVINYRKMVERDTAGYEAVEWGLLWKSY
jgi:hypothetical protein